MLSINVALPQLKDALCKLPPLTARQDMLSALPAFFRKQHRIRQRRRQYVRQMFCIASMEKPPRRLLSQLIAENRQVRHHNGFAQRLCFGQLEGWYYFAHLKGFAGDADQCALRQPGTGFLRRKPARKVDAVAQAKAFCLHLQRRARLSLPHDVQAGRYAALSQQSHRIHQRIQPFIVDERARIADAQGYGNIVWRGFDALAIHTIGQQGQATFGYIPPLSSI